MSSSLSKVVMINTKIKIKIKVKIKTKMKVKIHRQIEIKVRNFCIKFHQLSKNGKIKIIN